MMIKQPANSNYRK